MCEEVRQWRSDSRSIFTGGSWGSDGYILFSTLTSDIFRVAAAGWNGRAGRYSSRSVPDASDTLAAVVTLNSRGYGPAYLSDALCSWSHRTWARLRCGQAGWLD